MTHSASSETTTHRTATQCGVARDPTAYRVAWTSPEVSVDAAALLVSHAEVNRIESGQPHMQQNGNSSIGSRGSSAIVSTTGAQA